MALPEWIPGFTIIALLIGLPITLIVAWAFELTPDGLMKTDEVPQDASIAPNTGQRINYVIIGVLISAVIFFAYDKWFSPTSTSSENVTVENQVTVITDKTIAVLPFVSFSGDDSIGWLADGLTEEILNTLVKTRDLKVSSRTSSFSYKGTNKPVAVIAKELGVAHILEGSVRQSGERTRITAQLIRATDGFHLWSETYDSTSGDIIQIQEDIAIQIATALQTAMDPQALSNMMSAGTSNVAAYEAYLEALTLNNYSANASDNSLRRAADLLEKAISLDPSFASAQHELVFTYYSEMSIASGNFLILTPDLETARRIFLEKAENALNLIDDPWIELQIRLLVAQIKNNYIEARRIAEIMITEYFNSSFSFITSNQIVFTLIVNGERDRLTDITEQIWDASTQDVVSAIDRIIGHMWSLNTAKAYEVAKAMFAKFPNNPSLAYQAHRVYLWAGKVEEAKDLVPIAKSDNILWDWPAMVDLRQACAEGRKADAETILNQMQWKTEASRQEYTVPFQSLMLMNRKQEANDSLRVLEKDGYIFELMRHMYYPYFDVREFPTLLKTLESQGLPIPEYIPVPFACE